MHAAPLKLLAAVYLAVIVAGMGFQAGYLTYGPDLFRSDSYWFVPARYALETL